LWKYRRIFLFFFKKIDSKDQKQAGINYDLNKYNRFVFLVQSTLLMTTPSISKAAPSTDHLVVDRSDEYFQKQLDLYAEKIERLSNDVISMRNKNDELNRQVTYLTQCLTIMRQDQQK
jgi:hypothetical protein